MRRRDYRLPLLLLALTVVTTLYASRKVSGQSDASLFAYWPFSVTLMMILLTHELGHYFTARYHHVDASLPHFIPGPPPIGTFGAFIRMRSPVLNRKSLVHIGAAGPLAGLLVAIPALYVGLHLSEVRPVAVREPGLTYQLGDNLIFSFVSRMVVGDLPDGYFLSLHPVAFAAWVGLFVTCLNLIPVGQLDGGHIAYSVLGRRSPYVGAATVVVLYALAWLWLGWFIWGSVLLFVIGLRHPPPIDNVTPIDGRTRAVAVVSLLLLGLTFTPNPIQVVVIE
ncbi:MAG: site-2 protease family protein [Nitrospirae bacterium]|nr:site-2 protease family protein [Nitrospirota bacterium]